MHQKQRANVKLDRNIPFNLNLTFCNSMGNGHFDRYFQRRMRSDNGTSKQRNLIICRSLWPTYTTLENFVKEFVDHLFKA